MKGVVCISGRSLLLLVLSLSLLLFLPVILFAGDVITDISISQPFFNPTLGQKIKLDLSLSQAGMLTVQIVDRDGYLVRSLASLKEVAAGKQVFEWDGKNDEGEIVPDEAYSLKIELKTNTATYSYFPANNPSEDVKVEVNFYDRQNRIFSYKLQNAARVHIQAGSAKVDPKTKTPIGPVMKTIVDREPRPSGAVIEHWSGYDESGTIFIPDLLNFVTSVAATALPENSVISLGHRTKTFVESVANRRGTSLFTFASNDHSHHQGLSTVEDLSPKMELRPVNAVWMEKEKTWKPKAKILQIEGTLEGPSATYFASQPGGLWLFLDGSIVNKVDQPDIHFRLSLSLKQLAPGVHIVSVNWGSKYGPTSANSFRIETGVKTPSGGSHAASK